MHSKHKRLLEQRERSRKHKRKQNRLQECQTNIQRLEKDLRQINDCNLG